MSHAHSIRVSSYAELLERVSRLRDQHPEQRLVFRGQNCVFGTSLIPSSSRGESAGHLQTTWERYAVRSIARSVFVAPDNLRHSRIPNRGLGRPPEMYAPTNHLIAAILQHYGWRSNFIDVSRSLNIALWFSHHFHCSKHELIAAKNMNDVRVEVLLASYLPAWLHPETSAGYLFILAPKARSADCDFNNLRRGDMIDLSNAGFSARMTRQKAGVIYAGKRRENDINLWILKTFKFALPLEGAPKTVISDRVRELFPTPETDHLYAALLRSALFRNGINEPGVLRRQISIPEYYSTTRVKGLGRPWKSFRKQDAFVFPTYVHQALENSTSDKLTWIVDGRTFAVKKATALLTDAPTNEMPVHVPPAGFLLGEKLQSGVFIEYSPLQAIGEAFDKSINVMFTTKRGLFVDYIACPNARGAWVVQSGSRLHCKIVATRWRGGPPAFNMSPGSSFVWKGGILVSADAPHQKLDEYSWIALERKVLLHSLGLVFQFINVHYRSVCRMGSYRLLETRRPVIPRRPHATYPF